MSKIKDYIITTKMGLIPYVIDYEHPHFKKVRKVFLDDFLFKDSFYDKNLEEDLRKFISVEGDIILAFKNEKDIKKKQHILYSKGGNYKLTEERYNQVLKAMKIENNYTNFTTGKTHYNGMEIYEPKNLDDFLSCENPLCGTQFINNLTDQGIMLYIEEGSLKSRHLNDSDNEYEKYMLSINEMGAFTFLSENNYKALYEYLKHTTSSSA